MTWITDDINALFAAYLHRLELVDPVILLKMTLVAGCLLAFIVGVVGAVLPFLLAELEATTRRREREERKKG